MTGDERRSPDETESGSDADDAGASGESVDLDALSYAELQSLAADHGIPPVGHGKANLRTMIAEAREEGGPTAGDDAESDEADDADPADDPSTAETVDGDDPGPVDGETPDAGADALDEAADADADADEDPSADDGDESVPDWVKSDEPAARDVVGPEHPDDAAEAEPEDRSGLEPEDRAVADDELHAEPPVDATEGGETDDGMAQSDGGATVVDGQRTDLDYDHYDDAGFADGPESDEEMPLADHIEEMVRRLGIVVLSMALVSVLVLPFAVDLINVIWYSILGSVQNSVTSPRAYQPLALVLARLKVATLAGFVIALPVFVYETYLFMRPGLYKHERRYYLAAVPTSLILAFIGVAFAFYLVLPFIFSYFVSYSEQAADIAFGLTETFGLMLLLMGFFAAVFQIPLLIMLAVMMGLTTREWLAQRRLYFWGGFLGVALLFSPDPTGMAPFIVAITMVVLFEGTLLLLRWTQR